MASLGVKPDSEADLQIPRSDHQGRTIFLYTSGDITIGCQTFSAKQVEMVARASRAIRKRMR
jgi:hypothetical protein